MFELRKVRFKLLDQVVCCEHRALPPCWKIENNLPQSRYYIVKGIAKDYTPHAGKGPSTRAKQNPFDEQSLQLSPIVRVEGGRFSKHLTNFVPQEWICASLTEFAQKKKKRAESPSPIKTISIKKRGSMACSWQAQFRLKRTQKAIRNPQHHLTDLCLDLRDYSELVATSQRYFSRRRLFASFRNLYRSKR